MNWKMLSNDYAQEFLQIRQSAWPLLQKYTAYQSLFKRACTELTEDSHAEFTSLFARVQAIGRESQFDIRHIDAFRRHAYHILDLQEAPNASLLPEDEYALAQFLNYFSDAKLPLPPQPHAPARRPATTTQPSTQNLRVIVEQAGDVYAFVRPAQTDEPTLRLSLEEFPEASSLLTPGTTLNLVSTRTDEEQTLHPLYLIYEPDFLLDVTALTACLQPQGSHPLNYIVNKLRPRITRVSQLRGEAANLFVDNVLHHADSQPQALYMSAMQQAFHQNILGYMNCSQQVNASFFNEARLHFDHILQTIRHTFQQADMHIDPEHLLLEPSFICPTLGLRGRLDMMSDDHTCIIELKSGKIDEFHHQPQPQHVMQMALYKEMVHYNLHIPRTQIRSFLLYSKYPKLFDERVSTQKLRQLLMLRNQIVRQEQALRQGCWPQIQANLTLDTLNARQLDGKLFHQYIKPDLETIIHPLQQAQAPAKQYFAAFLAFIEREQFIAKTGDNRPDSYRGFANVWNTDYVTRRQNGDVIAPLQLKACQGDAGIESVEFTFAEASPVLPNFNLGEMVQLYPITRTDEAPNVQQAETIRAILTDLTENSLTLILSNTQRSAHFFSDRHHYAVEHDYTDATFSTCYRGLFRMLTAPVARQTLYLNQRQPECNPSLKLTRSYGPPATDQILQQAKQATDFYLLSGPPGCGKTNIMLRAMVEEFMASYPDDNLLLTAYTNRAVDEICAMLKRMDTPPQFVRLGNRWATDPQHRPDLIEEKFKDLQQREEVRKRLEQIHIIVGTVATIGGNADLFELKHFRTAIVDEASQLLEPQLAPLLFGQHHDGRVAIDKFIFIGDEKQLPAVVSQPDKRCITHDAVLRAIGIESLSQSLFQRLLRQVKQQHLSPCFGQVRTQGRMHPDVSRFANHYFYADALNAVPLPHQTEELALHDCSGHPLSQFLSQHRTGFIDITPHPGHSYKANEAEARALLRITRTLLQLYRESNKPLQAQDIGIIVPFRNQIALVRSLFSPYPELQDVTIDTVECYQGSQREIILFGTTISQPYQLDLLSNLQQIDGYLIDRKLNVALTRARRQCFMLGQKDLLLRNPIYTHYIMDNPNFTLTASALPQ